MSEYKSTPAANEIPRREFLQYVATGTVAGSMGVLGSRLAAQPFRPPQSSPQPAQAAAGMLQEKDVRVTVRDGARMAIRIYRPEGPGPFPTLFAASAYRYDNDDLPADAIFLWRETGPIAWYVDQGYAYVHGDVRGSGLSEGDYTCFGRKEQEDLYDIIEWIAAQPWSNGKVGTFGQSYYCMAQWLIGALNPPHLACMGAYDGLVDLYSATAYPGGMETGFQSSWYNGVRLNNLFPANGAQPRFLSYDYAADLLRHPLYDEYWKERAAVERLDQIKVPVYSIGLWVKADLHLAGNIMGYQQARGPKKLLLTASPTRARAHTDFQDPEFHRKYLLPFYDKYLKGLKTDYDSRPNVEYTVFNTGQIRSSDTWPPAGWQRRRFYLGLGPSGSVTSLNDGALAASSEKRVDGSTRYSYPNPDWENGVVAMGPHGPDPVRAIATFTTQPLDADLEIAGNPKLTLFASTTRSDMDLVVKVSEQFEQSQDDRAKGFQPRFRVVTMGWHRVSHMERDPRFDTDDVPYYTHAKSVILVPGRIYKVEIALLPIAYRFRKNSRIRLEIAPHDSFFAYRADKIGSDTLYHDAQHPSELLLPVLNTD